MEMIDQEVVDAFVVKCHFDLDGVKAALSEQPDLVNWQSSLDETPLGAAAHVGNRPIMEYLLAHGADMEFCAAVALGMDELVRPAVANDPSLVEWTGAHGIHVLVHATISGQSDLAAHALHGAIHAGNPELVRWLLDLGPDLSVKDFRGKTPRENAQETGNAEIIALLT